MTNVVRVRRLTDADLMSAAELHRDVLDMEFLARYGLAFMRTYYQAWVEAPQAIALAAVDERGNLVGALLGALDPATHTRAMVRRHGARLVARLVVHALGHPALAKDLVVTRGRRYARGLARMVVTRFRRTPAPSHAGTGDPTIGEITHVLVRPDHQGSGSNHRNSDRPRCGRLRTGGTCRKSSGGLRPFPSRCRGSGRHRPGIGHRRLGGTGHWWLLVDQDRPLGGSPDGGAVAQGWRATGER